MKFSYKFALIASLVLLSLSFSGVFAQTSSITGVVSPTMNTLNSVFIVNNVTETSDDLTMLDAWAVGDGGVIVRWNGTAWAVSNSNTTADLYGTFFVNSTHGWAVGANGSSGVIQYYNGTWNNWHQIINNGTAASSVAAPMYAITGDGNATSGWAVGANGTIYGWNSTTSYSVPSGTNATLRSVAMIHETDEAWAAGDNGTILYYNNQTNTWTKMPTSTNTTLYTITMLNSTFGWAAGGNNINNGTVLFLNGTTWSNWNRFLFGTNSSSPQQSINSTIYSISLGNSTSGWGVGTNGMVMYFNGTDWTCNANVIGGTLRSVSMVHGIAGINEAWAVGDSGLILAFTGTKWIPEIPAIALPVLLTVGLVIVLFGKAKLFKKTLY